MTATSWSAVVSYLGSFSGYYPAIEAWCSKVRRELPSGRRSVFACVAPDGSIDGLAITKNGASAKLCHISVESRARVEGLGGALMCAAVGAMLQSRAQRVHVTTSEEVAASHGEFFERCGFRQRGYRRGRYRAGSDELEWVGSAEKIGARALDVRRRQISLMSLRWEATSAQLTWAPCLLRAV